MFIAALFGKGQKLETTQVSFDRTMNTPWNTTWQEKGTNYRHNDLDQSQRRSQPQMATHCTTPQTTFLKWQRNRDKEQSSSYQGLVMGQVSLSGSPGGTLVVTGRGLDLGSSYSGPCRGQVPSAPLQALRWHYSLWHRTTEENQIRDAWTLHLCNCMNLQLL